MEKLLDHEEAAEILGISTQTLGREVADKKIAPVWVRGQRKYEPAEMRAYIERSKAKFEVAQAA